MPEQVTESAKNVLVANWGAAPTALVCLVYISLMIVARWFLIADPTRRFLLARLDESEAWLGTFDTSKAETKACIEAAKGLLAKARAQVLSHSVMYYAIWSGSRELAAWKMVHSIECILALHWPDAQISARLTTAREDLLRVDAGDAKSLAQAIDAALKDATTTPEARKCLLQRALEIVYDEADNRFAALSNWDNKTMWLVHVATLAIVVAAAALGHPAYLLVGALGGAFSRMSRVRKDGADNTPTDYGASWTSLFLSPLAGALAGWAGIFTLQAAVKLGILGAAIAVDWNGYDRGYISLGCAFAFGFSERLVDRLVGEIERKASPPDPPPPPPPKGESDEAKKVALEVAKAKAAADKAAAEKAEANK